MGKQYANGPLERCAKSSNVVVISYAFSVMVCLANFLGNKIISLNFLTMTASTKKM